jgi:hypothetical protein
MKPTEAQLTLRMSLAQKAWLDRHALEENRSVNAAVLQLIDTAMREYPLEVVVHTVEVGGAPAVYTVSVGMFGDDLAEWTEKADAVAAARRHIKALGLPRDALKFNLVTDKGEAE